MQAKGKRQEAFNLKSTIAQATTEGLYNLQSLEARDKRKSRGQGGQGRKFSQTSLSPVSSPSPLSCPTRNFMKTESVV